MSIIKYKTEDGEWQYVNIQNIQPLIPVQETGTSVLDVMSQDAVTKELDELKAKLSWKTLSDE